MKRSYLIISLIIGILFLLILVAAAIWIPHRFLSNEVFRQEMNRQTNTTLQVSGEWMPFRLDKWVLRSDGYEGSGSFSEYGYHIRAEQISFKINWRALLRRQWQINPIEVSKLDIEVTPLSEAAPAPPPPTPAPAPSFPLIAKLFIPQDVAIQSIRLNDASLTWTSSNRKTYHLNNIKANSIPGGEGNWSTSVTDGTFTPPERFPWKLNSARLVGNLEQMNLDHAEWFGQNAGVIKLSGPLTRNGKADAELKIEGRNIPATVIAPAAWKNFIQGYIDSDATAHINHAGYNLKGEANGKGIRLVGVPMLRSLSLATGLREWTELPLETAWLQFEASDDYLNIPSSIVESPGILRMEGNLQLRKQQLSGVYQVGLAPRVVSKIPGASLTVFTLQQNNYYWAQPAMTLSGTMENPKEDLSPRLKSAIFDAVEEKVNQGINKGLNILDSILQRIQ